MSVLEKCVMCVDIRLREVSLLVKNVCIRERCVY